MSSVQSDQSGRPHTSRGRLRRSGRSMLRVGLLLLAISLAVTLVAGLATRSLIHHLQTNSSELIDGRGTVELEAGAERALYVTGGLVAPGEDVPTPVEDITCTVAGPDGPVPVNHLKDDDRQVGIDNPLARFQVVGSFRAAADGEHQITCSGLGVVVAPEVSPASMLIRVGALMLGSLGVFAGATLALIGAGLSLLVRHGTDEDDGDGDDLGVAQPPAEGAEEWWEEENDQVDDDDDSDGDSENTDELDDEGLGEDLDDDDFDDDFDETDLADADEDGFIELTDEELASMSEEEIAELLRSGAMVYVDEDGNVVDASTFTTAGQEPDQSARDERGDTFR
ncbi:hypothetical protein [Ornithinimicrobium tianjinense]|uniref:Uncharacterized protein n=1 Tax=Ornithinimicrobium tianjinense TaxID=1195761 RepID=A0A917BJQ9_9MICO|nr:hypothetical protein [Ornithinimicrobium tianjinense]GGF44139.1 hypothetical protein GCM10011366_09800 [Ornithinimicrobium tianjinense]